MATYLSVNPLLLCLVRHEQLDLGEGSTEDDLIFSIEETFLLDVKLRFNRSDRVVKGLLHLCANPSQLGVIRLRQV